MRCRGQINLLDNIWIKEPPARLEYAKIPAVNLLPAQFYVSGNGEDLER